MKTRLTEREQIFSVDSDSMDDGTVRSICKGDKIATIRHTDVLCTLPIKERVFIIEREDLYLIGQITAMEEDYLICKPFNPSYAEEKIHLSSIKDVFVIMNLVDRVIIPNQESC